MEETVENSVENEVTPPTQEVHEEVQQKESVQDRNWFAVRQKLEQLERANLEKDEIIKRALSFQPQPMVQEEPEEPDDEFIPKGKVKKIARKEVEALEKKIQQLEEKLESRSKVDVLVSLSKEFPDFEQVVTPENLALLEQKKPKLALSLSKVKDSYDFGVQSYEYIKALNLTSNPQEQKRIKEAEKKLEKNSKTIQTPQAFDKRPMAQAFQLTNDMKRELEKEMNHYAAFAGSVPELNY